MIPFLVDNFRGGISDEYTRGIRGAFKFGYGLDIHKRRDSLSCNYAMQTISSSVTGSDPPGVTDLIRHIVTASDNSTYAFGDTGRIYSIAGSSTDPDIRFKASDANGNIKGAAEWQESSGTDYLYWATATSVARKVFPGDDAWGDTTINYKVTLDSVDYHTMKPAAGSLMIANGNYLAEIAYDGSFDPTALNIRPGNLIKCLEERDDYVILGSYKDNVSEEGHIWNWIAGQSNWQQKRKIPVKGINALIDTEVLLLQGGTSGELFFSDFVNTTPLNNVDDGGQANPMGTTIFDDLAIFGIYGTTNNANPGLYSFGRKNRSRPYALNFPYRLAKTAAGSTVTEIGAVWTANDILFASWKTVDGSTTEYGVDMVSSTTRATARYESLEFDGQTPHLDKQFDNVKVVMEALPASTSLNFVYKMNRNTDWRYANVAGTTSTTYSTENSTEAEFIINDEGRIYEKGVILNPSGSSTPEINAIVTYLADVGKEH